MTLSWKYAAETPVGDVVSGVVYAINEKEVLEHLRGKQLTPLTVEKSSPSITKRLSLGDETALSLNDLSAVSRRISDLMTAGLPLIKSLELASDQSANEKQERFFAHLVSEVRAGRALSDALANGAVKAPPFMIAIAKAGENIGALGEQFTVLADHYERTLKTRREISAQLVYPAALMVLILLTMVFLSFFILPQFEAIFENAAAAPPPETRLALAAGGFIRSYIAFFPFVALMMILAWRFASRHYRAQIEQVQLRWPVTGRLQRDHELGRYCRSLSTMLKGGMVLAEAMPLASDTVQLQQIRTELSAVEHDVRAGDRLSAAFARHTHPQKEMVSFLEVGDETGTLSMMTQQAADFAERRVSGVLKRFMALLSPVLTAIMGLVTAGVIAAVMSGVLSLNDAVY